MASLAKLGYSLLCAWISLNAIPTTQAVGGLPGSRELNKLKHSMSHPPRHCYFLGKSLTNLLTLNSHPEVPSLCLLKNRLLTPLPLLLSPFLLMDPVH